MHISHHQVFLMESQVFNISFEKYVCVIDISNILTIFKIISAVAI